MRTFDLQNIGEQFLVGPCAAIVARVFDAINRARPHQIGKMAICFVRHCGIVIDAVVGFSVQWRESFFVIIVYDNVVNNGKQLHLGDSFLKFIHGCVSADCVVEEGNM